MALPDFLVIGAPKAGTTALHAALARHPQLYMSPVKEPKYFLCDGAPPRAHRGPGDAHSAQEWIWRRDRLRGAVRRRTGRHAARREHPVLPLRPGGARAHPRDGARGQAHRRGPRPGRPGVLELDAPVVRRARAGRRLRGRVRAEPTGSPPAGRRSGTTGARPVRRAARAPVHLLPARAGARAALPRPGRRPARRSTAICAFLGVDRRVRPTCRRRTPGRSCDPDSRRVSRAARARGCTVGRHFPPRVWRRASAPLLWALHANGTARPPLPGAARRDPSTTTPTTSAASRRSPGTTTPTGWASRDAASTRRASRSR